MVKIAFQIQNIIYIVIILAFTFLFLFKRGRFINIMSGLVILTITLIMEMPFLVKMLIILMVIVVMWKYIRYTGMTAAIILLLLLPIVTATWVYDPAGTSYPIRTILNGTYTGTAYALISNDGLYQKCVPPVSSGPVNPYAFWAFDENAGVVIGDGSGNGQNGTTLNNPLWVAGKLNSALQFNGVNQSVNFTNSTANFERSASASYEFWIKTTVTPLVYSVILGKFDSVSYRGWYVYLDRAGGIDFVLVNALTNYLHVKTTSTVTNGVWRHIVVTYDGSSSSSGVNIYLDGVNQTLTVVKNNLAGTILTSENFKISRDNIGSYFTGSLDEIVIYPLVLTATQVMYRYINFTSGFALGVCSAIYDFDTTIINLSNVTTATIYYGGESYGTPNINFSVWNWTTNVWEALPNSLTFHSTTTMNTTTGIDEYVTNNIPVNTTGIIRIKTSSYSSEAFVRYDNWMNIDFSAVTPPVVEEELISSEQLFNVLLVILMALLIALGYLVFGGLVAILYVILYSGDVWVTLVFLFLGVLLLYAGYRKKQN